MKSIWQKLERPILILAPMEDVTDTVFRRIVARCGRPDIFFTEFTSVDGLFSKGYEYVAKRLEYTESERPLIAQIWGAKPENYYKAAKLLVEAGFDGIDINMGCPEKRVVSQGLCSALINNMPLAGEIIQATKEGAEKAFRARLRAKRDRGGQEQYNDETSGESSNTGFPVSVKTRIGFKEIQTEEWIGFLLEQEIAALTVHGRTAKEMSKVPAHWNEIGKAVAIRNDLKKETLIIGNGDVQSHEEALEKSRIYGVDGIMIGRGIFQDPWLFNKDRNGSAISFSEKAAMLIEHVTLFENTWGEKKHFPIMKKFFKCYVHGMENASVMREELMKCDSADEVRKYLQPYLNGVK